MGLSVVGGGFVHMSFAQGSISAVSFEKSGLPLISQNERKQKQEWEE
jgi:hypothetical protein